MDHFSSLGSLPSPSSSGSNESWMPARVLVVLIAAVGLFPACDGDHVSHPPQTEYVEQGADERTFNDWTLENVGFEVPVSLGEAVFHKMYNDRLFVWDGPSMKIKRYSLNGELEATYGNGQGQAPGQFQHISSFAPHGTEEVWIVDDQVQDITRFRYDGTLVDHFRTDFRPYRMTVASKDRFVVQQMLEPKLFALFNAEGEVLKRFGTVLDMPEQSYFQMLEGQLFPNRDEGFIWAPLYASYLYFYSADGTLERRIELIDGHSFPVEEMQPNPLQSDAEHPPQRTRAVSLTDDEIFVNVTSTEPVKEDQSGAVAVLDRYDRSTGMYLDSKTIRFGGTNYLVHDGMMYGLAYTDTTFNKLRIHR